MRVRQQAARSAAGAARLLLLDVVQLQVGTCHVLYCVVALLQPALGCFGHAHYAMLQMHSWAVQ